MLVTHPSPHPRTLARPFTPKVLRTKERTLVPCLFIVFTFGLAIKSVEEFGGVSHGIRALVELDPPIGEFQWHQRGPIS
jgi:hypothetical protein